MPLPELEWRESELAEELDLLRLRRLRSRSRSRDFDPDDDLPRDSESELLVSSDRDSGSEVVDVFSFSLARLSASFGSLCRRRDRFRLRFFLIPLDNKLGTTNLPFFFSVVGL